LRSVCNTLPGESVGRLFELFLRNQTGVFAEGRKNKCLGAYIVTSNVFLSMLYPDQLRHLRQQKSHHPYIRKRHRPQMTQRYSHVSSWHLEAAQERLVQKLKKIALSILDICKWFVRARSSSYEGSVHKLEECISASDSATQPVDCAQPCGSWATGPN
jgi:hypothetical protein